MYISETQRLIDQARRGHIQAIHRAVSMRDHFEQIGLPADEYVAGRCSEELAGLLKLARLEPSIRLMEQAVAMKRANTPAARRAALRIVKSLPLGS